MERNLTETEISAIAALGFRVYMSTNPHFQTYCFYSDGTRIGYLQREDLTGGLSVSTVHLPNRQTGTGFKIGNCSALDRAQLESGFITAPGWANSRDLASIRKYKSLAEFLASRNGDLVEVGRQKDL
jgi:hypothetical protein